VKKKWSTRLLERASPSWGSPLVWWVKQSEAEKALREIGKKRKTK
jgi:hypothetical protein